MALTITKQYTGAGKHVVRSLGNTSLGFAVYDADMDTTNYAVNGEPIASALEDFKEVLMVIIEQKDTSTEADARKFAYDYAASKIVFYDAFATEETASDQTVVALRLLVIGVLK